jgi:hypothetical protein
MSTEIGEHYKSCPCRDCDEVVPTNVCMCAAHWNMVPDEMKDAIMDLNDAAYRPGGGSNEARFEQLRLIREAAEAVDRSLLPGSGEPCS